MNHYSWPRLHKAKRGVGFSYTFSSDSMAQCSAEFTLSYIELRKSFSSWRHFFPLFAPSNDEAADFGLARISNPRFFGNSNTMGRGTFPKTFEASRRVSRLLLRILANLGHLGPDLQHRMPGWHTTPHRRSPRGLTPPGRGPLSPLAGQIPARRRFLAGQCG